MLALQVEHTSKAGSTGQEQRELRQTEVRRSRHMKANASGLQFQTDLRASKISSTCFTMARVEPHSSSASN
jgi:hypothetical protein